MSRIYWDTMLFVYWLGDHPLYAKRVRHILSQMEQRQDQLCTSSFTVGEILLGPYKSGSSETARQIREVFREPLVEIIPYTLETADFYGRVRAQHGVSPADSIHLACAAQARIDLFLTNDAALVGKNNSRHPIYRGPRFESVFKAWNPRAREVGVSRC